MKKILSVVIAAMLLVCMMAPAMAEGVKLGQSIFAAHGTKCFAVITVAMQGDKIADVLIDEYQPMAADTSIAVPNSETIFAALFTEGKVLASKVQNAAAYSENMKKAGSTVALDVNYKALEDFATGKTIAELEAALEGKTAEQVVDAVTGCTLVDAQAAARSGEGRSGELQRLRALLRRLPVRGDRDGTAPERTRPDCGRRRGPLRGLRRLRRRLPVG